VPLLLFASQLGRNIHPHALTLESTPSWLGSVLRFVLILSYILVTFGLGALLTVYAQHKHGEARALVSAERVTLAAACCVVLALFFLGVVNEYPFHPGRVLESFAALVLVVTAGCAAYCHSQLRSQKEGAWKVWALALIPLLIALGTYYPGLRYAIQDWFELRKSLMMMLS
jgi:cytochrome bd-type quinol oxidase subunit 2